MHVPVFLWVYVPVSCVDVLLFTQILCRLMLKGYKRPLEEKDLWSLNSEDRSQKVVPQLVHRWVTECNKVKRSVCAHMKT